MAASRATNDATSIPSGPLLVRLGVKGKRKFAAAKKVAMTKRLTGKVRSNLRAAAVNAQAALLAAKHGDASTAQHLAQKVAIHQNLAHIATAQRMGKVAKKPTQADLSGSRKVLFHRAIEVNRQYRDSKVSGKPLGPEYKKRVRKVANDFESFAKNTQHPSDLRMASRMHHYAAKRHNSKLERDTWKKYHLQKAQALATQADLAQKTFRFAKPDVD